MNATAQPGRARRLATSRPVLIGIAALALYALTGFLAAPWLIKQQLPKLVEQHLGAQASVGQVRINPFLFSVEAIDLTLSEKNGLPALQVGRLFVDFEASSLLRWAWTFREIRIERPVVNADLDTGENLNLLRLLAPLRKKAPEEKDDGPPPRLLLQHVAISSGTFRFTDHTLRPAAKTQLEPVNFEIHDVSTLPDHRGEHQLSARLPHGGTLLWQGKLSLAPIDSTGSIAVKGARLSTPWQFVRDQLTIAEPQGTYHFGVRYQLGYTAGSLKLQADELTFGLQDVALSQRQGGALLGKMAKVEFSGGSFNLTQRSLAFKNIRIADGVLNIALDENGVPDWARLVIPAPTPSQPAEVEIETPKDAKKTAPAPWNIALPKITVDGLALGVTDHSRATPVRISAANAATTLGVNASIATPTQVVVNDGALKLSDIRVAAIAEKDPAITLDAAEITGIAMNLKEKKVGVSAARLSGGRSVIRRDAGGEVQLARLFAPRTASPPKAPDGPGFSITVDRAELAGYAIALSDQSFQPEIGYDFEQLNVVLSKIALPATKPSPFELSLQVKQGGSAKAKGTLDLGRPGADLSVDVSGLALTPLDALLRRDTMLALGSGTAGASGRVVFDGRNTPAAIRYTGNATVSTLELQTAANRERLFAWKTVTASDVDFNSLDNKLGVARIALVEPYARLIVNKDRSTNLSAIRRTTPAAAATPVVTASKPLAINVERVSVERGAMDFADLSLVLPFATHIKGLGGSVNGLSSAPESRASLKFEGRIEDYGLARAEGAIQPFAPKKFTDIAVVFRNVELTPMSAYSATFAGRKIASGKLSLDLQYKLDNSKLAGENKVLLEQFTLGERVESPTAVNLPLDLAIALLTDSSGKIDLSVPVSGDVDNPEFSYGHIVWQAIRTVITGIVTAPFRALGSLFGSGAEDLSDIVFDPGSARILPSEYEKLRRVAEGLQKRPQLRLVVQGMYHQDSDSRALRAQAVRGDLATREGLKLAPGEDPGPVSFDNAKTQRMLENMLEARSGGNAVAQFVEAFRKTSGRDAPRVNAALAVVGRGAGDRGLYVAMHQRLIELQPLPDSALSALAQARGAAIARVYTERLKFDPARLGSKPAQAVAETVKDGVPARLSFEPVK